MKTERATEKAISGILAGHLPLQVVDSVQVVIGLDPWFSLRGAAGYMGLSVRTLRAWLTHPERPLPYYRVNGKILLRRSELDRWLNGFRQVGIRNLDTVADEMIRDLQGDPNRELGGRSPQRHETKGLAEMAQK